MFDDDFTTVQIFPGKSKRSRLKSPLDITIKGAYKQPMPISSAKKKALLSLVECGAIPTLYRDYYMNLPCVDKQDYIDDLDVDYSDANLMNEDFNLQ